MKTYALYNKLAGNGEGRNRAEKLKEVWKDREITFVSMDESLDYASFAKELSKDDVIVICGGDGTLNRFINDTDGIKIDNDIMCFATGSGNDFLRDLGCEPGSEPVRINEYIENLPTVTVKGKTYKVLNGVGYGIDGYCCEVGDQIRRDSPNSTINYAGIAIKGLLFHYKPTSAKVTVDGKTYTYKKVWLAPTMNGRFYGGGMMPTPNQKRLSDDKKISTLVLYGSGKLKTLIVFPSLFKGEHIKHTEMTAIHEGKNIKVEFDRPVALQIDGETILGVTEYSMKA